MVRVEAGRYPMGYAGLDAVRGDGEGPLREVDLDAYWLDATAVTNMQFAAFVDATGHVTESETFGWAHVFIGQLSASKQRKLLTPHGPRAAVVVRDRGGLMAQAGRTGLVICAHGSSGGECLE